MSKKRIILLLLIIFLILLFSFLFKKFFLTYDDSVDREYVELLNTTKKVSITSPLSLNDETGRKISSNKDGVTVYYKIKLKSKRDKISRYKILLDTNSFNSNISDKYVKVLLSSKEDKLLRTYDKKSYITLDKLPIFKNKLVLHEGRISGHITKEFILRLWMSDFYVMDKDNQVFEGFITVYSY